MRTTTTLLSLAAALLSHAQITNGGFEDLNSNAVPQYWTGDIHLQVITIDSNGVAHTDSVVYDGGADYALSADARSGLYAMELRNGFDYTLDQPLVGHLYASMDTNSYQGFPLSTVPVSQRPLSIGFWAKYAPLGSDSAYAGVTVLDEGANTIGGGTLAIGGAVPQYTAFQVPITYFGPEQPAFVQLTFGTATPTGTATLGTRFLIDDVTMATAPNAIAEASFSQALSVFPLPADERCTVRLFGGAPVLSLTLLDAQGRWVASPQVTDGSFSTSDLPAGDYVVLARSTSGIARAHIVVVH